MKFKCGILAGSDIIKPLRDETSESQIRTRNSGSLLNDFLGKKDSYLW